MRFLIEIAYDGTEYKGWQYQANLKTIQGTIENAIKIILKKPIKLFSAGRTDAGVHAKKQIAHFDYESEIQIDRFQYNLNCFLKNEQIVVKKIQPTSENFDARFSCLLKKYEYYILVDSKHEVFLNKRYWMLKKFDIEKANQCLNLIKGTNDFSSFRDSQCQAKSPIRTIHQALFSQEGSIIKLEIYAKSFLHHQIRIIVGTIKEIIFKNEPCEKIIEILNLKNRKFAGITAPAQGLFLSEIFYA